MSFLELHRGSSALQSGRRYECATRGEPLHQLVIALSQLRALLGCASSCVPNGRYRGRELPRTTNAVNLQESGAEFLQRAARTQALPCGRLRRERLLQLQRS